MSPSVCTVCGARVFRATDWAGVHECMSCLTLFRMTPIRPTAAVLDDDGSVLYTLPDSLTPPALLALDCAEEVKHVA